MQSVYKDLVAAGVDVPSFRKFLTYYLTHPEFRAVLYMRLSAHFYRRGGGGYAEW